MPQVLKLAAAAAELAELAELAEPVEPVEWELPHDQDLR